MAELVDASDSKSDVRKNVRVRFSPGSLRCGVLELRKVMEVMIHENQEPMMSSEFIMNYVIVIRSTRKG